MAGSRLRADDVVGRRARAEQIVVAAGDLFVRWGYARVTMDDVARAAGVAKGTLYLHWSSREALFVTVLRRERYELLVELRDVLAVTPAPGLREFVEGLAAGIGRRPVLRAVFMGDADVLGSLAGRHGSSAAWRGLFENYVTTLGELGAIRRDWSHPQLMTVLGAAFLGTFATVAMMPDDLALDERQRADLIAETVARTLAGDRPLSGSTVGRVARATTAYVEQALVVARADLDTALGVAPPPVSDVTRKELQP
jgi:AcrR family transcriptional regulator